MGDNKLKKINNWQIQNVFLDDSMTYSAPVIQGIVDGKGVKTEVLLWFNFKEDLAMTQSQMFKIGEPNAQWIGAFLAAGNDPEDLEIKDTVH